jgi:uncharacterized protein YegJ (DUF2314 family)
MRNSFLVGVIAIFAPVTVAFGQSLVERAERDEVVHMASEEPAMREAFRKAAATLEEFLSIAARPRAGTTGYALKVAISDGRNTEYFWVNDFSHEGDRFKGTLNNEPRLVKKHRIGEQIGFSRTQIADWTYTDEVNGQMLGNFTACAILTKEPPASVEEFKRRYGLRCE